MNVIDCLAIAPYYLTLFFVPAPEMGPLDTSVAALVILAAAGSSSLAAAKKVKVDAGGFNAEMHEHAEELTNSFEQITDNFKLDKAEMTSLGKFDDHKDKTIEINIRNSSIVH